ncbi:MULTISPECIES: hypothetical protein [Thalassolituus]|uniref:hypothetical protein n=1 Tax=Thalassolituus TaxID=187492 RepID=UPI000C4756D6|nr:MULTISPECIES: hypothetical protein [Thalassolituus]MAX86145.1 hypothetical protein [Oceanospirillaceae bacterium]MED5440586.1 hypothetical protein [Pseudomonadota bacterium]|tara:strand:- start:62 stop:580 length:519 start_codon:yes stop_codon:yes gene_type:complete
MENYRKDVVVSLLRYLPLFILVLINVGSKPSPSEELLKDRRSECGVVRRIKAGKYGPVVHFVSDFPFKKVVVNQPRSAQAGLWQAFREGLLGQRLCIDKVRRSVDGNYNFVAQIRKNDQALLDELMIRHAYFWINTDYNRAVKWLTPLMIILSIVTIPPWHKIFRWLRYRHK